MISNHLHLILLVGQLILRKVVCLSGIIDSLSERREGIHHVLNTNASWILRLEIHRPIDWISALVTLNYESCAGYEPLNALPLHILNPCHMRVGLAILIIPFIIFMFILFWLISVPAGSEQRGGSTITRHLIIFLALIFKMVHYSVFAVRTSISPLEPLFNALRMEPMQTWQNHVFFFELVVTHTYCAAFILFSEILSVTFSKPWNW